MREAATFGMADILDSVQEDGEAVIVIEWAERLADLLPDGHLAVALAHVPAETDLRTLTFAAHGPRAEGLVDHLRDRGTL
jgi:tRNA A37 threonylcarbamoyladenosine biosynthesis protein TsaE